MENVGFIFTEGQIEANYPEIISKQLANIGEVDKIVHRIRTPGGNVQAGYNGYHELVQYAKSKGIPIDSIVEQAESMGSFIMLASDVTGGKISVIKPGKVMIHYPKFNVEGLGSNGYADSDVLESGANELRIIENEMAETYSTSMEKRGKGKSMDDIKAMMKKETHMSAEIAVQLGLADEVLTYIDKSKDTKLKAVAMGEQRADKTKTKVMENSEKTILAKVGERLMKFGQSLMDGSPKAVDLPLKEGGMLSIDGEAPAEGMMATIDGQPANGAYVLETGETVTCENGMIKSVTPPQTAQTAQESEAQKAQRLAKENEELKAQLAQKSQQEEAAKQAEQQKLAAEQLKKVEAEKAAVAKALEAKEKEIEALKKKTVGDDTKQYEGMNANRAPVGYGGKTSDEALKIKATRTYLADNFPWLERHYGGKYSDGTRFADYRTGGPEAVSILETNFSYTWNGVITTDIFFKPTLSSPALSDIFTIDLGAKDTKRYNLAPTMSKVLKPYTGCDQAVTGSSFDITDKKIQLKPFQMYEGWCKDDFTKQLDGSFNFLAQEWLKTGNASFDPAGTPIDRMIVDALKDALRRDVYRRAIFAQSGNSSADWNQIDGLFTTLKDQSGASNYCVYASKTNFGTGALAATAAYNELIAMYNGSSNLLKQWAIDEGRGKFYVTRSIWENLYTTYTGVGAVTELAFTAAQKGLGNLTFRGIPVIPITIWDDFLADSANPHNSTTRHIIMFTVKENNILGVEDNGDLTSIDSWFEKKDNKRYYRSNMDFGVLAPLHCDLTTISY